MSIRLRRPGGSGAAWLTAAGCPRCPTARRSDRSPITVTSAMRSVRKVRRRVARDRCHEPVRLCAGHEHGDLHARGVAAQSIRSPARSKGRPPHSRPPREVAAQACSAITNAAQKADCIFDVTVHRGHRLRADLRDHAGHSAARHRLAAGARRCRSSAAAIGKGLAVVGVDP